MTGIEAAKLQGNVRQEERKHSGWVRDVCKDLTLRYFSQGGGNPTTLNLDYFPRYIQILQACGEQLSQLHDLAFTLPLSDAERNISG